jgi:predicted small lipoprotein YifL
MDAVMTFRVGLTAIGLLAMTGCGKKGPLVYPDQLVPEAPQSVQLDQRGNSLQLSFNLPAKDRRGRSLQQPFVMQVQRRELAPDERGECGDCPKDYQPAMRIDPEFPAPALKFGNRLVLLDADVRHGKRYQYRLVAVGKDGEAGVPAETVRAMVCTAPSAPTITATTAHGGIIVLDLQSALPDNAELVGYAIYRASGDEALPFLPLATTLGTSRYEDQSVQRGVSYRYAARMVIRRWDEQLVFSELSAVLTTTLSDDPR